MRNVIHVTRSTGSLLEICKKISDMSTPDTNPEIVPPAVPELKPGPGKEVDPTPNTDVPPGEKPQPTRPPREIPVKKERTDTT